MNTRTVQYGLGPKQNITTVRLKQKKKKKVLCFSFIHFELEKWGLCFVHTVVPVLSNACPCNKSIRFLLFEKTGKTTTEERVHKCICSSALIGYKYDDVTAMTGVIFCE